MSWQFILAVVTSIGYGVLSAIVPVVNAEAYVAASEISGLAVDLSVAIGVGIGQTIGKVCLFLGVRQGKESRFFRQRRERPATAPRGPIRTSFSRAMAFLLNLVGHKRWGLLITFAAALVGLPPLYAVALLAGGSSMKLLPFAIVVLIGRVGRFVAVALGVGQLMG